MTAQHRVSARMITMELAMKARQGLPDPVTLASALSAVGRALDAGDPLVRDLDEFAEQFPRFSRDPELLSDAGERLWSSVERSTWPRPMSRSDIEG
ncbi:hypothetical protein [Paracoccus methylarcula]|uniref:Uncharacterized protein n=1 Tax=Paracoccus methylarcula TaxID=72022 RepID=A0A3R7LQ84_9RHOB|nr:hypothetical protein [Paracoccus methylarcula]RNF35068.1 hypothetical protein A7A09_008890 [Paracoccus methylarcula]